MHEVAYRVRQDELGAMGASPRDETVGIDGLDCAAAAGAHDECWLRARCPVLPPDVWPIGEAHSLRER